MAHVSQERYSNMVDAKLRQTLVTRDNVIFNTRYEGNPKARKVKIPVRDTEVEIKNYDKTTGVDLSTGSTAYIDLEIDQDEAVNELIDGYDAATVPDNLVADRLDSAGYSLALSMDTKSVRMLEKTEGVKVSATKTALTETNAYKEVLKAKTYLSRTGVPNDGLRWMLVSPEFMEIIMQDEKFIKQGDLSQQMVQAGAIGKICGFTLYESNNLMFEDTEMVASKKTTTEFVCGHPNWCHRVNDWQEPVGLVSLKGSGKFIGASAVQGRKIYGMKISKPQTVYVKRVEA